MHALIDSQTQNDELNACYINTKDYISVNITSGDSSVGEPNKKFGRIYLAMKEIKPEAAEALRKLSRQYKKWFLLIWNGKYFKPIL